MKKKLAFLILFVFLIHVAEEYWGGEGFLSWNKRTSGANLDPQEFIFLQSIALILILAGIFLYLKYPSMRWILSALAATLILNGISHLISSIRFHAYSPGLLSGLLLFIPAGSAVLLYESKKTTARHVWGGALSSLFIQAVVSVLSRII